MCVRHIAAEYPIGKPGVDVQNWRMRQGLQ
jgi:hypothetical protein